LHHLLTRLLPRPTSAPIARFSEPTHRAHPV